MMRGVWAAITLGLLDMRGDFRRFALLIVCLAVGTALIAGVSSVGASIKQAVERDAAVIVGGDVELSRADRPATPMSSPRSRASARSQPLIDTNVRAQSDANDAFVDLVAVGEGYPLVGQIEQRGPAAGSRALRLPRTAGRRISARWSIRCCSTSSAPRLATSSSSPARRFRRAARWASCPTALCVVSASACRR